MCVTTPLTHSDCRWCSAPGRIGIRRERRERVDLFGDVSGPGGPDERPGLAVVAVDIAADGGDQFPDIAKDASAKPMLGEIAEEALDHIQP